MKEVTIENVKARIAQIENAASVMLPAGLGLSLKHEFELACLRKLLGMMQTVQVLPSGWRMVPTETQPAPVVPDEIDWSYFPGECHEEFADGWNACRAAMLNQAQEPATGNTAPQPAPVITDDRLLQNLETRIRSLEIGERKGALSTQQEAILKAYRLAVQCLRASATSDENATDNTAQQFEALAVVKHYVGNTYPTLKFAQDEWCVCGDREDAQELADAINALSTSAGSGKP